MTTVFKTGHKRTKCIVVTIIFRNTFSKSEHFFPLLLQLYVFY